MQGGEFAGGTEAEKLRILNFNKQLGLNFNKLSR